MESNKMYIFAIKLMISLTAFDNTLNRQISSLLSPINARNIFSNVWEKTNRDH